VGDDDNGEIGEIGEQDKELRSECTDRELDGTDGTDGIDGIDGDGEDGATGEECGVAGSRARVASEGGRRLRLPSAPAAHKNAMDDAQEEEESDNGSDTSEPIMRGSRRDDAVARAAAADAGDAPGAGAASRPGDDGGGGGDGGGVWERGHVGVKASDIWEWRTRREGMRTANKRTIQGAQYEFSNSPILMICKNEPKAMQTVATAALS
jgi:hypothetical protein